MATLTVKCPNCGGGLKFDPESQKSKCEYCLSEFSNQELSAINEKLEKAAEATEAVESRPEDLNEPAERPAEKLVGYVCDSCGAEVVTEETTSATFCYYCHNPVLLTSRLSGAFKPDKIIPFQYDKEKAIQTFLKWSKTRKFVPSSFYSSSQLEKITGLYIPYWMADYQADVDYAGKGINRRTWVSGTTEYTETKEYAIERKGAIEVDHLHEIAMKKINKTLIDSITPFDESQAVDFSLNYLSGFFAEKYDIPQAEVKPALDSEARDYVSTLVRDSISGFNQVAEIRNNVNLALKSWQYSLFPAWILTYQYQGKTYVYAVNGQNGKAYGELPVNQKKLSLVSGLIAAGLMALAVIGGMLIW